MNLTFAKNIDMLRYQGSSSDQAVTNMTFKLFKSPLILSVSMAQTISHVRVKYQVYHFSTDLCN